MFNIPQLALAKLPQLGEHQTRIAEVPGFLDVFFAFPCKPSMSILPTLFNYEKKLDYFSHSGETTSWSEKMRSVCFLALFLCVAGSPRIQTPQDQYVCHTWNNRESGRDYCCLQSCDINQQQQPYWCYVREIQNHAKYCSPTHTETHKGMFDGYYLLLPCSSSLPRQI